MAKNKEHDPDEQPVDEQPENEGPLADDSPDEAGGADASRLRGFPVVGIGASAGGLAAFEAFFAGMPKDKDPGMAFVLVQHLAPDHKSILTDIIRRYTRMQVFEVEDGMVVQPNCIYIIPPGRDMAFLGGALHLMEPVAPRGQRLPIDFFLHSLAQDQREKAIGVVLSGTGSDGTIGVRAIKGEGGMVMAQTPESTEYDGMPRSAIATGMVDYELPPAEMAARIISYTCRAFGKPPRHASAPAPRTENAAKKIFVLLRSQTGHDFSQYKPSTVYRRIERRMAVHQIDSMDGYIKFLQSSPGEVETLFRDFLIGVTSFFRDHEAFKAIEERVIPDIFAGKPTGSTLRLWSAGCSTGEEAYSLAILMQEQMDKLKQNYAVQIFATDIDKYAIARARAGVYPAGIAADISPERMAEFFTTEPGGNTCRIHKTIRDKVIFSTQDIIKDPPFSKLDLIVCRNLLIYMGADLQKKVIPMFHYAMNPGGYLFLGTSETVGEYDGEMFVAIDRKCRLYRRKEDYRGGQREAMNRFLTPMMTQNQTKLPAAGKTVRARLPLRELTEQTLLQQVVHAGALVNEHGDILYIHGRTGMYLEPAQGEVGINNILKMAREGLRNELVVALHKASTGGEVVRCPDLRVKTNGDFSAVNLIIRPVPANPAFTPEAPLFLVILEEVPSGPAGPVLSPADRDDSADTDARVVALRQELRNKEEYLQTSNEELETSNEELKSSNEEMQSVNEELQSTNEELETSKEELQSVNEELATVNIELQTKLTDLSRTNNDMNNLLAGSGIGTVFVDYQLCILRFTPAAARIINLIASDVGRPVGHVVSNLVGYDRLVEDTRAVQDTLIPKEAEVQAKEGRWYMMRIQPYRTLENVIEGTVITFVDITDRKLAEDKLRQANEHLRLAVVVVRDSRDAITVQDLDGRTIAWNPGAVRMYGWSEEEALAMNVSSRIPEELREDAISMLHRLSQAEVLEPYLTQRLAKDGAVIEVSIISTALVNEAGQMYAIATTERQREKKE
jgi:two-component system CheB/CheR fusion protein